MGKTPQVHSIILLSTCCSGTPHHSGKLIYHLDEDVVFNYIYILNFYNFYFGFEFWPLSHSAKPHTKLTELAKSRLV